MEFLQFPIFLQEKCHISRDQPVIVGVSGGADSMCLLDLLHRNNFSVIVAHLDHKIRASSGEDAAFVRDYCEANNIPIIIKKVNVITYCSKEGISIEEGARNKRYGFLLDSARKFDAKAVLIGHHADDQVETILMHFLRGAGLSGLKGMTTHNFATAVF